MLTSSAAGPPIVDAGAPAGTDRRRARFVLVLVAVVVLLALLVVASLLLGVRTVAPGQVWAALVPGAAGHDPANADQAVVLQLRVPRTVLGLLAGVALGCVGTVI